jgi:hypothetical protein
MDHRPLHLIFAGAIVIMYFVIAYDIWPHLTGRALERLNRKTLTASK